MELLIPCSHRGRAYGRKRGQDNGECSGKLKVPNQGRRAKAKELSKTSVDELLIKVNEH